MDAAPSLWRPLGEMLVDRGLLTREELDDVLAAQKESGRKLGEIIVDRGYISGPTLALTLAEQWGVELTSDEGFGTGLRTEIQRRHEGERQRRPDLHALPETELKGHEIFAQAGSSDGVLAEVEAQLADDDARIVQLEARLSQQAEDRAQQQAHIEELVSAETARIEKALMDETAKLGARFSLTQKDLLAAAADWRAKHEGQIVKLLADKLGRLEASMKQTHSVALSEADKRFLERRVSELVTRGLKETRRQLLDAVSAKLAAFEVPAPEAPAIDLTGFEQKVANLVDEKLGALQIPPAVHETVDLGAIEKLLDERFEALELPQPVQQTVDLSAHERRVAELIEEKLGELELPAPVHETVDLSAHERRVAELIEEKLGELELPQPVQQTVDLSAHERRVAELIEEKLGELELPQPVQAVDLSAHERRVAELMDEKLSGLDLPAPVHQTVDLSAHERRVAELIEEKLGELELPQPVQQTVDLSAHERRVAALMDEKLSGLELPAPVHETVDLSAHERRVAELMDEKLSALELPAPVQETVDLSAHERRVAQTVANEVARLEKRVLQGAAKSDEKLTAANAELVEKIDQLAVALESVSKRNKGDRLERMSGDLHATVKRLDRLEELVRSSTQEVLERLEPPPPPPEAPATEPEPAEDERAAFNEHLVFAPGKSGYALITVELPPPVVGAEVSLGNGERYQVTKVADSPFPRDERPCAYLQRVS